jgi:hypothetical protein
LTIYVAPRQVKVAKIVKNAKMVSPQPWTSHATTSFTQGLYVPCWRLRDVLQGSVRGMSAPA